MVTSDLFSSLVACPKPCPFMFDDGIPPVAVRFRSWLMMDVNALKLREAPDQNRTDTRSLEGYCSTIELQAR